MRFVITGEWRTNNLLRLVIGCFVVYALLFWLSNALLYFHSMSLTPTSVINHYLGSADGWGGKTPPRSYKVLLEISHAHLFSMGILLLTLTHLLLFTTIKNNLKALLTLIVFVAALLNEAASWLIVYVSPLFAYLKISMFLTFEITLLLLIILVSRTLFGKQAFGK